MASSGYGTTLIKNKITIFFLRPMDLVKCLNTAPLVVEFDTPGICTAYLSTANTVLPTTIFH